MSGELHRARLTFLRLDVGEYARILLGTQHVVEPIEISLHFLQRATEVDHLVDRRDEREHQRLKGDEHADR
jgi:hypothetical protein